ncbi:zinc-binding dehydrogenase [Staphylococcus pasteuri]|uniref:zinc-binding dehydrogenase n=1 Tax=Staphylococcus TaxID=1279 RepID=UPI00048DE751|nr:MULTISPECIES: zinc-binding dehydrogenase [Staphylococcus]MBL3398803.1 zinc-binding dehydrogenase [Staphylococcus pasteuri]RNM19384.1 quinone oxidoreductase [Staphylococcus pasteuri]
MKAVVIYNPGDSEQLKYQDVETPVVKEGWSLVKIKGFGINRSEIFTRQGFSPSVQFPRILGIECVGVIEESTDPKRLPKNQTVVSIMGEMGRDFDGSYAQYALLPNEQIYPIDTNLSWEKLATIPETYYTAFGSMKNLKIEHNDKVLVRGATSGVGVAFLNLIKAKYKDVTVSGSTRDMSKKSLLIEVGFDEVIEDKENELDTSSEYDKVLELVGTVTIKDSFKHLKEGGILCDTGILGGKWYLEEFDPIFDIKKNSYLTSFVSENVDEVKIKELFDYIETNNIIVKPEKIFKLDEVNKAHDYLESTNSFGKVIVLNESE